MFYQLLFLLLLQVIQLLLALLHLFVKIGRQVLDLLYFSTHLDLYDHQLLLSYLEGGVSIEILEALWDFTVLHIVENIHPMNELVDPDRCPGEEGLGGELSQLFVLYLTDEDVFLDVYEGILEVIREIVSVEFLKKEGLYSGEDVDATLLAIEGLELGIVTRLVSFLFHTTIQLIN